MGKNTLKNTDFKENDKKITSKAIKITVFYYLCNVIHLSICYKLPDKRARQIQFVRVIFFAF